MKLTNDLSSYCAGTDLLAAPSLSADSPFVSLMSGLLTSARAYILRLFFSSSLAQNERWLLFRVAPKFAPSRKGQKWQPSRTTHKILRIAPPILGGVELPPT